MIKIVLREVGFILRRSEIAHKVEGMHEVPLDVCGADSQGAIGYSLQQNIQNELKKRGIVSKRAQKKIADTYIEKLGIKTPGLDQMVKNLSGGNQQKVLLARWLCKHPKLIILDEPTRGIDVGAKSEIELLIQDLTAQGISILMISSEMEELFRSCDRMAVLRDGEKVGELVGEDISEKRVMKFIAGEKVEAGAAI